MNKTTITLALAIISLSASAQKLYTLDELFMLAEQNAKRITISQAALAAAKEATANTKAQRLPDVNSSLSVGYNGRGLITDRDFTNPMNIYIPEFGNNFSLQVTQVIYAGGAISNSIRLSELGQRMAELDVEKNRQEVRFYIAGHYLDMLKLQQTMTVIEQNIALTEQLIANTKARVAQGTVLKNDATRYELQLETLRLQLRQTAAALDIVNHDLCKTLSLPEGTEITPTMPTDTDPMLLQGENGDNSPVLRQAALATKMAEKKVSLSKSAMLPKLAFVAEDHLNGPVTIEIPAINKNFNYWFAGVGIQYNISSLYKSRNDIRRAKHEQRQATEQLALAQEQMASAIHAAQRDLQTAIAELQTCEKQVQLANENYEVTDNRYQNGLALLTDMLDASNMKLSAEIAREQARIQILYHQKKLLYLTGYL